MRATLTIVIALASPLAASQTALQCEAIAIHKESRGESLRASRAVLSVIQNRMKIKGMTACEVVKKRGQFPWAKKQRKWTVTNKMLQRYEKVVKMPANVPENTYYFNHRPVKWGKPYKKIGKLYFNLKEK